MPGVLRHERGRLAASGAERGRRCGGGWGSRRRGGGGFGGGRRGVRLRASCRPSPLKVPEVSDGLVDLVEDHQHQREGEDGDRRVGREDLHVEAGGVPDEVLVGVVERHGSQIDPGHEPGERVEGLHRLDRGPVRERDSRRALRVVARLRAAERDGVLNHVEPKDGERQDGRAGQGGGRSSAPPLELELRGRGEREDHRVRGGVVARVDVLDGRGVGLRVERSDAVGPVAPSRRRVVRNVRGGHAGKLGSPVDVGRSPDRGGVGGGEQRGREGRRGHQQYEHDCCEQKPERARTDRGPGPPRAHLGVLRYSSA